MASKSNSHRRLRPQSRPTRSAPAPAAPSSARPAWQSTALLILGFMAAALLIYAPGLTGGFVWDDDNYVQDNLQLRTAGGLARIWGQLGATPQYYPLVFTSFWLEYHLWGLHTTGYHIVNALLHGASAALLYLILRRIKPTLALPVAVLFVAHPVMVESVQWITERKNTLSLAFALGSLLTLLPFTDPTPPDAPPRPFPWKRYILGLLLFTGAMLSKTVACSLPAVILVIAWYRDGRHWFRHIPLMLPFFAIGLALAAVTVHTERHIVGTALEGTGLSPLQRIMLAGRALWFYAAKLAWPWPTVFIYPKWPMKEAGPIHLIWPVTAAAVMITAWALRQRIGRGLAALLFIYAGVLVPALGFVDVYPFKFSFVADHFQYLAAPAFLCIIASAILLIIRRLDLAPGAITTTFMILAVALGLMSAHQARAYQTAESLYRDTIAKNPAAAMPHNNLGQILARRGDLAGAEAEYRAAIQSEPEFGGALFNLAEILMRTGREAEGAATLDKALAAEPANARIRFHAGLAYARLRNADRAIAFYQGAARLKPDYLDPLVELGNIYAQTDHPTEAIDAYKRALTLREDHPIAQGNLANALAMSGQLEASLPHYERALALDPTNSQAWQNYATTLDKLGRTDAAATARTRAANGRNP